MRKEASCICNNHLMVSLHFVESIDKEKESVENNWTQACDIDIKCDHVGVHIKIAGVNNAI